MEKAHSIMALSALAHESRLDTFRYLVQRGPEGAPVGEIAARLGLPAATLLFHLNNLRHAGLVTNRRASRSIIYSAGFETMNALLNYLTENCCQGHTKACAVTHCNPMPAQHRAKDQRVQKSAVRGR